VGDEAGHGADYRQQEEELQERVRMAKEKRAQSAR
jgi:hypothetical protein